MDSAYLQRVIGRDLADCLRDVVLKHPTDPIEFIALWLKHRDKIIKIEQQEEVDAEELARQRELYRKAKRNECLRRLEIERIRKEEEERMRQLELEMEMMIGPDEEEEEEEEHDEEEELGEHREHDGDDEHGEGGAGGLAGSRRRRGGPGKKGRGPKGGEGKKSKGKSGGDSDGGSADGQPTDGNTRKSKRLSRKSGKFRGGRSSSGRDTSDDEERDVGAPRSRGARSRSGGGGRVVNDKKSRRKGNDRNRDRSSPGTYDTGETSWGASRPRRVERGGAKRTDEQKKSREKSDDDAIDVSTDRRRDAGKTERKDREIDVSTDRRRDAGKTERKDREIGGRDRRDNSDRGESGRSKNRSGDDTDTDVDRKRGDDKRGASNDTPRSRGRDGRPEKKKKSGERHDSLDDASDASGTSRDVSRSGGRSAKDSSGREDSSGRRRGGKTTDDKNKGKKDGEKSRGNDDYESEDVSRSRKGGTVTEVEKSSKTADGKPGQRERGGDQTASEYETDNDVGSRKRGKESAGKSDSRTRDGGAVETGGGKSRDKEGDNRGKIHPEVTEQERLKKKGSIEGMKLLKPDIEGYGDFTELTEECGLPYSYGMSLAEALCNRDAILPFNAFCRQGYCRGICHCCPDPIPVPSRLSMDQYIPCADDPCQEMYPCEVSNPMCEELRYDSGCHGCCESCCGHVTESQCGNRSSCGPTIDSQCENRCNCEAFRTSANMSCNNAVNEHAPPSVTPAVTPFRNRSGCHRESVANRNPVRDANNSNNTELADRGYKGNAVVEDKVSNAAQSVSRVGLNFNSQQGKPSVGNIRRDSARESGVVGNRTRDVDDRGIQVTVIGAQPRYKAGLHFPQSSSNNNNNNNNTEVSSTVVAAEHSRRARSQDVNPLATGVYLPSQRSIGGSASSHSSNVLNRSAGPASSDKQTNRSHGPGNRAGRSKGQTPGGSRDSRSGRKAASSADSERVKVQGQRQPPSKSDHLKNSTRYVRGDHEPAKTSGQPEGPIVNRQIITTGESGDK